MPSERTQPHLKGVLGRFSRGLAVLRRDGLWRTFERLKLLRYEREYRAWAPLFSDLTDADRESIRAHLSNGGSRPRFSVLMPTYNTPKAILEAAIRSVEEQLYPEWQLCIVDDCSTDASVREVLTAAERRDPRITVRYRSSNGHISAATNEALSLATGEYVAFLDHDDLLAEDALFQAYTVLSKAPEIRLLFTDEDLIDEQGQRVRPLCKPGLDRELLLSQNSVCHLLVVATNEVRAVGGFRTGVEGAQDWDLVLRLLERLTDRQISHLPQVLYHWRVTPSSTAGGQSQKPYVAEAQRRVVEEHLVRSGLSDGVVTLVPSAVQIRTTFQLAEPLPPVLIGVTNEQELSLLKEATDYSGVRYWVMGDSGLSGLLQHNSVGDPAPFVATVGPGVRPECSDWLRRLVGRARRSQIHSVGGVVLGSGGVVLSAGCFVSQNGDLRRLHEALSLHNPGFYNSMLVPFSVSAVEPCCALYRLGALFSSQEGPSFTLRFAPPPGLRAVSDPTVRFSSRTGLPPVSYAGLLQDGCIVERHFNPLRSEAAPQLGLAFPPRYVKPWGSLA